MRNTKTATKQRRTGSHPEGQQLALDYDRTASQPAPAELEAWRRYWAAKFRRVWR